MRTGTKFAGLLTLWAVVLISGLFLWLIISDSPITNTVWPIMPQIITAILGTAGLNLSVNEVRKALENGALSDVVRKIKKKGDEV